MTLSDNGPQICSESPEMVLPLPPPDRATMQKGHGGFLNFFRRTSHNIKINNFKVYKLMALSIFIMCSHHLCLVPKHFFTPKGDAAPVKHSLPICPFPWALATTRGSCVFTDLLCVFMDLLTLDISYKLDNTIYGLLCLTFHLA